MRRLARSVVAFAQICAFVLLVSTMLEHWAWDDDLVVVLFEFLDDDTKLAQSCTIGGRRARPGSGVCTPDVELGSLHRIAHGVRRWTVLMCPKKNYHLHHITSCSLFLTCPLSRVSLFCVSCPGSQTVTRRSLVVFVSRWPRKVLTQGDFCAVP